MKFTIVSTELQKALNVVGGVIPSKSPLPILENFLFDLSKEKLTIIATDLDTTISMTISVKSSSSGKIAVPAKRLTETIRALANTEVAFAAETEGNRIVMNTENGEYKLTGESSENYPPVPVFKANDEMKIGTDTLRRLITKSLFAVSTDELRPAMMGVLFQIKKNEIRAVATDGHRLVRLINSSFSTKSGDRDVIVPGKALGLALKSLEESESTVSFSDTHAMFSFGGITLVSRMIEEKYPNYESVIPVDNDKKVVVDRNQLISSVRRTALYASTTTHQVRFSLKKGSIAVSAEDVDFGSEAKETLPCEYSSEPMEIAFNAAYMIDILSHVDTNEIQMMLSTPTRAGIIKPVDQQAGENLLMLVMPVRLNT
ncbi:MAG TPA: DNA polymerase III subunit beta [Bacteroidota bacterium]|jgi:DNA polymerase-3 subunit beta|nr:DNA polymerase III subunit beta [Bacteroidota bacterium]